MSNLHWIDDVEQQERQKILDNISHMRNKIADIEKNIIDYRSAAEDARHIMRTCEQQEYSLQRNYRGDFLYQWIAKGRVNRKIDNLRGQRAAAQEKADAYDKRIVDKKADIAACRQEIKNYEADLRELPKKKALFEREALGPEARQEKEQSREILPDRLPGRDPEGLRPANREQLHPTAQGQFTAIAGRFDWEGAKWGNYQGPEDPLKPIREQCQREQAEIKKLQEINPRPPEPREQVEQTQHSEEPRPPEEPNRGDWKDDLKEKIDRVKAESRNMEEFQANLAREGIQTHLRGDKIISYQHPTVQTNIRGTTLGNEYSRDAIEQEFAERQQGTDRGDADSEYNYKSDHPFDRMCEAGARYRDDPSSANEKEFFAQKENWTGYRDEKLSEIENRDDDRGRDSETGRDNETDCESDMERGNERDGADA